MTTGERRVALARLILGVLQMGGAVFSATLIWETGLNPLTLAASLTTVLITVASLLLFGRDSSPETPRQIPKRRP